jgi:pyruvate,orthophosphate dikinase
MASLSRDVREGVAEPVAYAVCSRFGLNMALRSSHDFATSYVRQGILPRDPFLSLAIEGVGRLIELGTTLGRKARPDLKVGVCGEQGDDPDSIAFFARVGVAYVSASPFRVPIARLAAAHARLGRQADEASAD